MSQESNVTTVLKDDGVEKIILKDYENLNHLKVTNLINKFGSNNSWAVRIAYNKDFGGVLIQQLPGEGNRVHKHPDANECWVIIKGKWRWFIEGKGEMEADVGSIINVEKNTFHQITCIGKEPGIRYAITVPDVTHVYK